MEHEEQHWENEEGAVANSEIVDAIYVEPCSEGDHSCIEHRTKNCKECAEKPQ